ncbi:MAG: bifunctional adenosylcobinamide kinase/adenosylcobinamide-phosphate guanylyltransferase [Acidimicrobiales bacterium]|nr:bifunctional adenosylcobinamide kinase/adenosylcobinamide-phosphate guanylyltransferase [Acidimicrobiales bacterium]
MIVLVLGGARSGKSGVAEALAGRWGEPVSYLATGWADDADMAERIALHRARRPRSWTTVEAGTGLVAALREAAGTALVDSLGTWLAATPEFAVDVDGLCRALTARAGDTVLVSDEVGLGVHPETEVGRRFRDALGEVNAAVAAVADEAVLVVAGRVLRLDRP